MNCRFSRPITITALLLCLAAAPIIGISQGAQSKTKEIAITSWLVLGPFPTPLPALHDELSQGFAAEAMLNFREIDISKLRPNTDGSLRWHDGTLAKWKITESEAEGIKLSETENKASIAYLGIYLDVKRWTKATLYLQSHQVFRIRLDGRRIKSKTTVDKNGKDNTSSNGGKTQVDLKLETGKHLLLVKTVFDPSSNSNWTIKGSLSLDEKFDTPPLAIAFDAKQRMRISHLLDGPKVSGISISPDGELAALSVRRTLPRSDDSETWIELYDTSDSRLIQTFRGGMTISGVNWAPTGQKFSYTIRNKSLGTIWIVDLKAGTSTPLLKNIKDLGRHVWSPNSGFIIYSAREEGKEDRTGVKRFQNLADRQPGWRNRNYLYKASIPEGISQRLTCGEFSTYLSSISPDGKRLLFTRSLIDYSERPYSITELYSLDLETLEAHLLWKGSWFGGAQWIPGSKKLLVLGGPSAFGNIGIRVPNGFTPNEYDTQAYLFDPETQKAEPLTKNFNPSINRALWSHAENCFYFITTDRSYRSLYKYDMAKKTFTPVNCGVEVIDEFDIAREKPIAVYTGSSATVPPKAFLINLQAKKSRIFKNPSKEDFAKVKFRRVERWTFKNKENIEIEGRIYYPPYFNPGKKYSCIVYYYGGTSPTSRDFGGRYPKNLWAAQGYVVYVLQPSGATGFGQKFSALHVNDWGIVVADEIIDGVRKFLAAHTFVNPKRVGCIGASYGGFITMLLQTRTNMFATAVAHAGISSISSYWGEGFWGYGYSAYATANSFPWNRKDIYINQSALFNADKITTPLLLLHGSVDTNVPPGESTQLFTALKLLGREVEYIQILDQDHHILTYNKRKLWTRTIMAWFDRWLKGQPEWWYYLYPSK